MQTTIFKGLTTTLLIGALLQLLWGPGQPAGTVIVLALAAVVAGLAIKRQPPQAIIATSAVTTQVGLAAAGRFFPALPAAAHLLPAMLVLAAAAFLVTAACLPARQTANAGLKSPAHKFFFRSVMLTAFGLLLLFFTGALVTHTGSGAACPDWPLCWGEIFPAKFTLTVAILLLHRFTAVLIAVLITGIILQARRNYSQYARLQRWSVGLGLLFLAQIAVGGLYSISIIPVEALRLVHLLLTAITWAGLIALGSMAYLTLETVAPVPEPEAAIAPPPQNAKQKALVYFKLTKPWVMILLLITTIAAMVIAAKGLPPIALMLYTLLGGALSAGGASVLNSYIDSDIDRVMSRTARRATVTGLVTPPQTLIFGLTLSALSFLVLAVFVNMLSAILSTIGIAYYVFFYTLYLKRSTVHNIIIGGAAGAIPPLVGWTAVANSLDLGAFYLFAIIFFWTPPHTWALAMMISKDYANARVPMLPVVVGERETGYQIWLYSVLLIGLTLLPFTFQMAGWLYFLTALLLGGRFLHLAWQLWRNSADKALSRKLYKYSQSYLALLFLMMAVDRTIF